MARGSAFLLGDLLTDGSLSRLPCWRKDSHATSEEAIAHLTRLTASGSLYDAATIEIYRCRHCHKWHVGHDRTKERDMSDINASLANGGVVAVFLGDQYVLPKEYERHPQVRAVQANTLVPGRISSTINGNVRLAVITDRIDSKLFLSLSGELRRRHIAFVLRKTTEALNATLDDALHRPEPVMVQPPPAVVAEPAPPPPAPEPPPELHKGRVTAFVRELLPTVDHLLAAEAGRRLYPIAVERRIQTTPASVEQAIRNLRARERPPIAASENPPESAPTTATDAPAVSVPPPPPAAPVQPPPSQTLAALHALDDALAGLSVLREWVAQADADMAALRNDNAQLRARVDLLKEAFGGELRSKLDLLDTL